MTARRGRRRKQLLDDIKEVREYWKLKEDALDVTVRETRFGRVGGPVDKADCLTNKCVKNHFFLDMRSKNKIF